MTYTVQETRERLSEILRKVQDGERVVISEEGRDVAEIRSIEKPASVEDTLRELERAGIVRAASEPRASLAEVVQELDQIAHECPRLPRSRPS